MKPKEKKPEEVFRIIDTSTGEATGSYSRAYCDEFDFSSIYEARNANVNGLFKNGEKYKIAKYRVTYELIDDDADPMFNPKPEDYPPGSLERRILDAFAKIVKS